MQTIDMAINSTTPVNPGQNVFQRERDPNEIDLIAEVRQMLIDSGLKKAVEAVYDNNSFIQNAKLANADVQRYALNRFWNLQLVSCIAPSIEERFCLIVNGSVADWLILFRERVLPYAIINDLPK